ncbi:MAG: flagellar motor protein MotB [Gammaproteobacteria bacterium]|nr:MAG: flagellar motor protein MotB [Gammaproteobacteria bacterium]
MLGSRRRVATVVNVWPGYVDALSALLMLIIFMLLIFTVAQIFLAETVSSRNAELDLLNDKLSEISDALQVQRNTNQTLSEKLSILRNQYTQGEFFQNALKEQIAELEKTVNTDRQTISVQLSELAQLEHDIITLRQVREDLEANVATLAGKLKNQDQNIDELETELDNRLAQIGTLRDNSKYLQARLVSQENMTMLVQKDIEKKEFRIQDLVAIVGEGREALEQEKKLSASAYANVKNLSQQIDTLKNKLSSISRALQLEEQKTDSQETQLANLGERLNTLLAERVNELEQYRSDFFGRLRQVLVQSPDIRIEGDRFLLPSALFFASASATLGEQGKHELNKLAQTLNEISVAIPSDINWILRVDGHTDQLPIHTQRFPSNWELSTARAVSVVRYLAEQGIPPKRMTAAGFGEFHPVDPDHSEAAYQRNRRIELKLTSR